MLAQSHWAARNQVLEGTGLENGYGARQMLSWLFTGNLYDNGHSPSWLPVITILVAVGIGVCVARWRSFVAGRALVVIWVVTLVLSFGRTTFGSLYDVVPGSSDIFIRRFEMAPQLSGILLAGVGLVFLGQLVVGGVLGLLPEDRRGWATQPAGRGIVAGLCIGALVLVLAPAWSSMDTYDAHNATNIGLQAEDDALAGPQLDRLLAYVHAHPKGRVYAGAPTNWGQDFLVGDVPVFKYLESKDIDEVGYTLRTASLMTDPEYYFDESNPGDYPLFGIGYIITPADMASPVEADKVGCSGDYCLWALPDAGYIHVYDTTGRAHGHPGRCRDPERGAAGLPPPRRATGPDGGLQRAGGGRPDHDGCLGPAGHTRTRGGGARRPARRHGERRGAHDTPVHGGPQRLLRPGLARHGERPTGADRHGGARAGRASWWVRGCTR